MMLCACVSPNARKTRIACLFRASIDRSRGVFLSSASPVYEQNAEGIYSVLPLIKTGEVQSQAV